MKRIDLSNAINSLPVGNSWQEYLRECLPGGEYESHASYVEAPMDPVSDDWSYSGCDWGWREGNGSVRLTNGEAGTESLREVLFYSPS
jgi:hypothetical protein